MRIVSVQLFSIQNLVASLVSLSALTTIYAVPLDSNYLTFDRRTTVTIGGKPAELGPQISPESHSKSKVYRIEKWDNKANPGYVVKYYQNANLNEKEIQGLKAAGHYVASDSAANAVVMKEVKGKSLAEMVAKLPRDKRKEFVDSWKPKVAKAMAEDAQTKGILHRDPNMNNIFVDGQKIEFVDWEHYVAKGQPGFTDDAKKIANDLDVVWDSTATPPEFKKTKSTSPKSTDPKSTDPKSTKPKSTDSEPTDPKSTKPKSTDSKSGDSESTSPKTTGPKTTGPKITSPKKH